MKNIKLGAMWWIKYHSAASTTKDIFMKMVWEVMLTVTEKSRVGELVNFNWEFV